jgi:hypothetical protein
MDVKIETVRCGEFYATFFSGDRGDIYRFHTDALITRADCAWRQIVIAGEFEMVEKPENAPVWPVSRSGDDDRDFPDLVPGDYVRQCNEDGTFWVTVCAMNTNPPEPFESATFKVKAGERFSVPKGATLIVGKGTVRALGREVVGPKAIYAQTADLEFEAVSETLAVAAWRVGA